MKTSYKHWHCNVDKDDILWLSLDRAGKTTNTLNQAVFDELDAIITALDSENVKGLVIGSAKQKGFIAGADITQFVDLKTEDEAYNVIRKAQLVLDKLEALSIPTVAMISGFCLGGGTELALACRYRVAQEDLSTKIGLPEVKLGIHPGWGGSVRLPRLIGAVKAMNMILTGRPLTAIQAARQGVVDAAVPLRQLERAARYYVLQQPAPRSLTWLERLSQERFIRPLLAKIFYKKLEKKVNRVHYPAPYAVIENWLQDQDKHAALQQEARSIAHLMMGETARQLVRVFFLQDRLKGFSKGVEFSPTRVHVIGAGTMGGDIAAWCALRGYRVTLQDQSAERIAPAMKRAYVLFQKKLKEPRLVQAAIDCLQADVAGRGIRGADVVIEAIFEDLEVKQTLFKQIESQAKPDAVLATNTSSIPIEEIAEVLQQPDRLIGVHFFNPVALMPLVEVVKGEQSQASVLQQAMAFVGKIGRTPLPVSSRPGFLVNRILMPYLMEAMELMAEGVPAIDIDAAALAFGMPMGPIALADKVGLDICLSVAENLTHHLGGFVPQRLRDVVSKGHLGVKSGRGFYCYQNGKPVNEASNGNAPPPDITDRLILRMVNECVTVLDERVVEDSDLLDAGMIFGTGFAPFRGGPMQYAKVRGYADILNTLKILAAQHGERFLPHSAWESLLSHERRAVDV